MALATGSVFLPEATESGHLTCDSTQQCWVALLTVPHPPLWAPFRFMPIYLAISRKPSCSSAFEE
jgi:hypothetical protein